MGTEFINQDLTGARFRNVDLTGSSFTSVDLSGSTLRGVDLIGVTARGVAIKDVDISGEIESLTINGVEVASYVQAELERRHPELAKLRPTDADGFREAWDLIEDLWAQTVDRARRLDPALLHEQVDGEWSFIETLRHLAFATDAWVRRGILGDPSPWHPWDLPWDEMADTPGVPRDRTLRPTLDEALELRHDRMATVRNLLATLTDEQLASHTDPVPGPGWPPPESFPVRECLSIVLDEEFWHRQYAERDLGHLMSRPGQAPSSPTPEPATERTH